MRLALFNLVFFVVFSGDCCFVFLAGSQAIGTLILKNGNSYCMACGSRATHLLLRIEI
jgi:hypothetical protein